MKFNVDDYKFGDIVRVNREYLTDKFFQLTVENTVYVILITHIGTSKIHFSVYTRNSFINGNNIIESKINSYHEKLARWRETDLLNLEEYPYLPTLSNMLIGHDFELIELDSRANDFLMTLKLNGELLKLIKGDIIFNQTYHEHDFDYRFGVFIRELCIKKIENDENLQNKLITIKKEREKEKIELEKHMKEVREKEKKFKEFNEKYDMPYNPKNSSSYNIRW